MTHAPVCFVTINGPNPLSYNFLLLCLSGMTGFCQNTTVPVTMGDSFILLAYVFFSCLSLAACTFMAMPCDILWPLRIISITSDIGCGSVSSALVLSKIHGRSHPNTQMSLNYSLQNKPSADVHPSRMDDLL